MLSSRLAQDSRGRKIVVITSGIQAGRRYRVIGDSLIPGEPGVWFTGTETGRRKPRHPAAADRSTRAADSLR